MARLARLKFRAAVLGAVVLVFPIGVLCGRLSTEIHPRREAHIERIAEQASIWTALAREEAKRQLAEKE